jgi:hypothetical protein
MPLFSVGDALPLIGRKLHGSGVDIRCEPGLTDALEMYNKANRLLMLEKETSVTAYTHIPVAGGCVTLDRRIKRILQAKVGCESVKVVGQGFQFLDAVAYEQYDGCGCMDRMTFIGQFPTHRDLDMPRLIFAVSDRPEDDGAQMLVIGTDEAGAELRTLGSGKGMMVPIIYATCDVAPQFNCGDGYHSGQVGSITMLRKGRTAGYVQVWGLDERSGTVYWITTMAPDETSPALTRYRMNGTAPVSIRAHVSLQYVPLYDQNEVSLIQAIDAYEAMAQALHHYDANEYGLYQTYRNQAKSLIEKDRGQKDGTTHRLNVKVSHMPLQGRNFSMRGSPWR